MTAWLSRVQLARNPATKALAALINPVEGPYRQHLHRPDKGRIMDAHHRLIWSLFADRPARDHLWRAEGRGRFLILSATPPAADGAGLFDPPDVRAFTPDLRAGDRLSFLLRANATQTRKTGATRADGKPKTRHIDVVMDRLYPLTRERDLLPEQPSERAALRMALAQEAAQAWLAGQGARHGFRLDTRDGPDGPVPDAHVADYSVTPVPGHVGKREGQPQFGVMELSGHLLVEDADALLKRILQGFGRAKSFGCGLMLIRRA
ncbi:type I-E CRISPR-associated protein Cas6/Cse3/CasE [Sandaracinobacter neustonicus]|uniref:Type I-E CRISPR-associated protein Cas6/Cse3/CasE n=1 Tax=Sandaracinobacter neustonicus TaxID=1715348 RepID=A0A501XW05_9SPHN|nr:type I-E CRISPR-associated protein Cas6/Cse3/CasE [Sandaracinobacter neustonicus]TPE64796.1 type I-E CRISPR-associated protein Cas6/Cse3/CasE [Sandaracinobacter neustonicus]